LVPKGIRDLLPSSQAAPTHIGWVGEPMVAIVPPGHHRCRQTPRLHPGRERLVMPKIRLVTAATAAAIALATSAGCASSTTGAPAGSGTCSNPNPDPAALTFAGVVCVQRVSSARQRDGSSLLQLHVSVTNRDPNTFDVSSGRFQRARRARRINPGRRGCEPLHSTVAGRLGVASGSRQDVHRARPAVLLDSAWRSRGCTRVAGRPHGSAAVSPRKRALAIAVVAGAVVVAGGAFASPRRLAEGLVEAAVRGTACIDDRARGRRCSRIPRPLTTRTSKQATQGRR
jgi:hypothetical protein